MVDGHELGRGLLDGARQRCRWAGRRQQPADAGVALPVVEVADLQLEAPAGRPGSMLCDGHHRALADDVPPEAEPIDAFQLQAQAGRLGQGAVQRRGEVERFEDEDLDTDPAGVRGQPADEPFVDGRQARRQVHDEQVHGAARDERAGHA
jgi:hypothetical protein